MIRRPWLHLALVLPLLAACAGTREQAPSPAAATLTRVGQPAPALRVTTVDDRTFDLADQRGKVVLLNFWATWCPPCRQEMPHLRDDVWRRFGGDDEFAMISVAREETPAEVRAFLAEHDYGWTFATDPDRANFARYAEAHIPRSYVIGRDGAIVYQATGFEPDEFTRLVSTLAGALAAGR